MFKQRKSSAISQSIPSFDFAISITRSQRKTLAIQIKAQQVLVKAPYALSDQDIFNFVSAKQAWINRKIEQQQSSAKETANILANKQILVAGITKQIHTYAGSHFSLLETPSRLELTIPTQVKHADDYTKKQLLAFFKEKADQHLPQRTQQLSKALKLTPTHLNIKKYKARWGSCNSKGEISLNYLLMMTPTLVIDYVIIHELCHLRHMNHSARFWALVARHFPEYKAAHQWLKDHQLLLHAYQF